MSVIEVVVPPAKSSDATAILTDSGDLQDIWISYEARFEFARQVDLSWQSSSPPGTSNGRVAFLIHAGNGRAFSILTARGGGLARI